MFCNSVEKGILREPGGGSVATTGELKGKTNLEDGNTEAKDPGVGNFFVEADSDDQAEVDTKEVPNRCEEVGEILEARVDERLGLVVLFLWVDHLSHSFGSELVAQSHLVATPLLRQVVAPELLSELLPCGLVFSLSEVRMRCRQGHASGKHAPQPPPGSSLAAGIAIT